VGRPNVLWIVADDLAPYVIGAYGAPLARTPNLDRLAASSLLLERAFCTCPLSTPSNQASWTGRYPRSLGVTLSPTPLPPDETTLRAYLRGLGYRVGLVLDALEASGRADETVVVFSSDHGYLLGHHGRFEKHCCFEEGIGVALMIRAPGLGGERWTDALVELIDVFPTLLELAGGLVPERVQGRSLLRLLRGETTRHREHVVVEYSDNAEAAVRTERWKLIYCAGGRERRDGYSEGHVSERSIRLYDLEIDPAERHDLSDRPEHAARIDELTAILVEHVRRTERCPERLPATDDPHRVLACGLLPVED
jgi:arylsulfatase A-like enzyme